MLSFIIAVLCILLAVIAVVLRKTYYLVPPRELQRQAAGGDPLAQTLYRAVGYGRALRTLLWVVLALSSALAFVLLAQVAPAWMGFFLIAVLLWLTFSWLPNTRITDFGANVTVRATPAVVWLLSFLHPALSTTNRLSDRYKTPHTGLFEREDLLQLLDTQAKQRDSRITPEELDLVKRVLSFGDDKVRDSLRSRKQIKTVAETDTIGPILLDELHASGQTTFPVTKSPRSEEMVGSLQLSDIGLHTTGTVKSYMTPGVTYVHESDSLADALHVCYQTKRQLFIVVNSFEEYLGVISLQDILQHLVSPQKQGTASVHDDRAAVAKRHQQVVEEPETVEPEELPEEPISLVPEPVVAQDEPETSDTSPEPVSETDESMVE